jgi:hypothetical protein
MRQRVAVAITEKDARLKAAHNSEGLFVMSSELLTLEQFAEMVNTPLNTVRFWRQTGYGPKSARIGRRVMVRRADAEAWIEGHFNGLGGSN